MHKYPGIFIYIYFFFNCFFLYYIVLPRQPSKMLTGGMNVLSSTLDILVLEPSKQGSRKALRKAFNWLPLHTMLPYIFQRYPLLSGSLLLFFAYWVFIWGMKLNFVKMFWVHFLLHLLRRYLIFLNLNC